MALQFRRTTSSFITTTTFAAGEPVVALDTKKLYIGDGVTPGGFIVANNGPQGPSGPAGSAGAQGPQGPSGANGSAGAQGPQGPSGENGSAGAQGPQGPSGANGSAGAQGPQGPQGVQGTTGNTGPQGPQGVQGTTGNTGPQGPSGPSGASGSPFAGGVFTGTITIKGLNETVYDWGNMPAGTYTPDVSSGTVHKMTLTGNVTINTLANVTTGSNITMIMTQDGTGTRTLSSTMKFAGAARVLSTPGSSTDIISVFYDGTNYWASLSRGFA